MFLLTDQIKMGTFKLKANIINKSEALFKRVQYMRFLMYIYKNPSNSC